MFYFLKEKNVLFSQWHEVIEYDQNCALGQRDRASTVLYSIGLQVGKRLSEEVRGTFNIQCEN